MNRQTLLITLGLASALSLAAMAALGDWSAHIGPTLLLWGLAHALYLAACWLALRPGLRDGAATRPSSAKATVAVILAIGLIPRLALLGTPPSLSEDLYRYLWDGRLLAHGINPFAHAPADPTLSVYQDEVYRALNHASVPTIYPPAAQFLFAAAAMLGGTPVAWKGLLLGLEGLLLLAVGSLLRARREAPAKLLLYYWNPLVVAECYGGGHVDLAAAAFVMAALALEERRRFQAAGIAFGAAVAAKLLPLLLLPALLWRRRWSLIVVAALVTGSLYLPFLPAGSHLWDGLRIYARNWEFNGPLYSLLRPHFPDGDAPRLILAVSLALTTGVIAWRARSLTGAALATGAAFLLLSPTVYPWYLVPVVALLPLHPDWGLLVFSGTAALTYLPLPEFRASGIWTVPGWIVGVEYGGLLLVWAISIALRTIRSGVRRAETRGVPRRESPRDRARGTEAART
ncbi:MAG TPA: glycosyltransferase 87 family protein, partial [Candidatus Eisenbacteria bacterium]|nr:glycosyltransferase 87 family protein [Candidatus Eisenbacteria bacterium]